MKGDLLSDVVVTDVGVDAVLVQGESQLPVLVLRPDQTFGSAVNAVRAVMPSAPLDKVRETVRTYLPHAVRWDEFLPLDPEAPAPAATVDPLWHDWLPAQAWAPFLVCMALMVAAFIAIHSHAREEWSNFTHFEQTHPSYHRTVPEVDE